MTVQQPVAAEPAFELVYQDASLLVADKPAGLLSVPGRGADKQDCLSARVQAVFPDGLIVHRLDMATSGLLMFARGADMQRQLSELFSQRRVEKRYLAVVSGAPPVEGEIALPLIADWPNRPLQKVDFQVGKPSLTRYRLLQYDPETDTSRLELEPVTGRSHQLRVHLSAIGHPILGDLFYGGATADRLHLHAHRLSFMHPVSGACLNLSSPSPF